MKVAEVVAERSKCSVKVGAVIVGADGRVQATGYNGPPAGYGVEDEDGGCAGFCPRRAAGAVKDPDYGDCPSNHAEINALLYSDQTRRWGGIIYITKFPCLACAKAIANSGLRYVVLVPWDQTIRNAEKNKTVAFLESCGVRVELVGKP